MDCVNRESTPSFGLEAGRSGVKRGVLSFFFKGQRRGVVWRPEREREEEEERGRRQSVAPQLSQRISQSTAELVLDMEAINQV